MKPTRDSHEQLTGRLFYTEKLLLCNTLRILGLVMIELERQFTRGRHSWSTNKAEKRQKHTANWSNFEDIVFPQNDSRTNTISQIVRFSQLLYTKWTNSGQ